MIDDIGNDCLVSVDGTDMRTYEPRRFSKKWYSHKFHGPGLRYEIAVAIRTGLIVAVNGPYPCGSFPDAKIFKNGLQHRLGRFERIEGDKGYAELAPAYAKTPKWVVDESKKELQN